MARCLAMGDIHGCDIALELLLKQLKLAADDTLVVLGDVVDRGPNSRRVVEQLLETATQCRLIFVMGNHEEMLLDSLAGGDWARTWQAYGGRQTVVSYGSIERIPEEHLEFFGSGLNFWETEGEIFIHANLEPGVSLEEQSPEWLRWTHLTGFEQPHPSGKRVICGHTPQRSGLPLLMSGWVGIDTLAFGPGWLTVLDVATDQVYQANQAGKIRQFSLAEIG